MSLRIREALAGAAKTLHECGVSSARLDAEVLLGHVLKVSRTDIYLKGDALLTEPQADEYSALVQRRSGREPVAYLTGEREFMSLLFRVNREVLIPRPETELIVEEALVIKPLRVVDVGTGSGAIAVSIAYYLPGTQVWATDVSAEALEVARHNAVRHLVADRVSFFRGSLLEPLNEPGNRAGFDLITANLPYIPSPEMDNLPIDVRGFEPAGALDGGPDGLDLYRDMCPQARELLHEDGVLMLEIGYDQADSLVRFLSGLGFREVRVIKDLAGLDRVVVARGVGSE